MLQDKKFIYGAVIGGVVVYLLMRKKKQECPACPKCGNGGINALYPALVVPPAPAPAPAPVPPPPPPPPPLNPKFGGYYATFVGFSGWGNVK